MFKLETDRLILRDMSFEDECAFVAISQDAKYQRFYDESDCEPNKYRELTQLFVAQALEVPRQSYQLAVESKDSGKFIGTVCLRLEGDKQASMGCAFSRETQGKGLSIEASEALANFGFSELGIHRIYAETISKNLAVIKLCKSLGMKQEACFKDHRFFKGQWWDTVVLAVVRSDWGKGLVMESERLKLTPPSLKYSEEMFEVINECKAEFSPFLPWVSDSLTKEQLELNIQDATNNFANFTGEFWFNIIEKQTGAFIGAIGFMIRDDTVPYFEIGYWLQTSKTGLGYVSEAVRIIEEYAFTQKGAKRVEIRMAGSNLKSQAVAKRCGYQLEDRLANDRRLPSGDMDSTLVYAKISQS